MKPYAVLSLLLLIATGCGLRNDTWYSVNFANNSNQKLYGGKVIGWPGVLFAGSNPGTGGSSGGLVSPVPDQITLTWKTAKEGGKEYYEKNEEIVREAIKNNSTTSLNYEMFPSNLFEDHSITVVLKDRVPRRLQGKIYINIYNDDRVEVSYVETTSRGTVKPRGTK
jgi:hypothetical protein